MTLFGGLYVVVKLYYLVMESQQGVLYAPGPVWQPGSDIFFAHHLSCLLIKLDYPRIAIFAADAYLLTHPIAPILPLPFVGPWLLVLGLAAAVASIIPVVLVAGSACAFAFPFIVVMHLIIIKVYLQCALSFLLPSNLQDWISISTSKPAELFTPSRSTKCRHKCFSCSWFG